VRVLPVAPAIVVVTPFTVCVQVYPVVDVAPLAVRFTVPFAQTTKELAVNDKVGANVNVILELFVLLQLITLLIV
jgi:hypothetical protein